MASALAAAGFLSFVQGEYVTAMGQLERALLLYRELGDRLGTSDVLDHMGLVLVRAGVDLDRAEAALEESQALGLETGSNDRVLYARWHLGDVAQARGDYRRAAALYRESLIQVREKGDEWVRGLILFSFGVLAWLEANHDRAAVLLRQSLRVRQSLEDRIGIALCLHMLAGVAAAQGEMERAARLFGAAEGLRVVLGAAWFPQWEAAREWSLAATRWASVAADYQAAREMGRRMTLEEALQEALSPNGTPVSSSVRRKDTASEDIGCLTRREREVAALLSLGLSNRRIAGELVITAGTAALHVKAHSRQARLRDSRANHRVGGRARSRLQSSCLLTESKTPGPKYPARCDIHIHFGGCCGLSAGRTVLPSRGAHGSAA